jgi:hypothetical protein
MRNGDGGLRVDMDDLGKLQADLERLPRHQWDNYLWEFCSRFVQRPSSSKPAGDRQGGREAADRADDRRSLQALEFER